MKRPTPLFTSTLTQALGPRLAEGAIVTQAHIVELTDDDLKDPRLADDPTATALNVIIRGSSAHLVLEWPDGVLARAFLPVGDQLLMGMRASMLEAYARGRATLEAIHLQHLTPTGSA